MDEKLIVALGEQRYVVERPWGRWPTPGKVTDVAVCSRGHAFALLRGDPYVEELADCVVELDRDGCFVGSWGRGRIMDAHKIACDAKDRIWIVDRDAHEVVCFDRTGREVMGLGARRRPLEPFNHPSDVAFAPDGTILVADGYGGGCVRRFNPRGRELHAWGEVGVEPGAFLTVHGVWAMRDGRSRWRIGRMAGSRSFMPTGGWTPSGRDSSAPPTSGATMLTGSTSRTACPP